MKKTAYVREEDGKYKVYSEAGKCFGTYDTKAEAEERLQQMHHFKSKEGQVAPILRPLTNPSLEWKKNPRTGNPLKFYSVEVDGEVIGIVGQVVHHGSHKGVRPNSSTGKVVKWDYSESTNLETAYIKATGFGFNTREEAVSALVQRAKTSSRLLPKAAQKNIQVGDRVRITESYTMDFKPREDIIGQEGVVTMASDAGGTVSVALADGRVWNGVERQVTRVAKTAQAESHKVMVADDEVRIDLIPTNDTWVVSVGDPATGDVFFAASMIPDKQTAMNIACEGLGIYPLQVTAKTAQVLWEDIRQGDKFIVRGYGNYLIMDDADTTGNRVLPLYDTQVITYVGLDYFRTHEGQEGVWWASDTLGLERTAMKTKTAQSHFECDECWAGVEGLCHSGIVYEGDVCCECGGTGECKECHGLGDQPLESGNPMSNFKTCESCGGSGKCPACQGTGKRIPFPAKTAQADPFRERPEDYQILDYDIHEHIAKILADILRAQGLDIIQVGGDWVSVPGEDFFFDFVDGLPALNIAGEMIPVGGTSDWNSDPREIANDLAAAIVQRSRMAQFLADPEADESDWMEEQMLKRDHDIDAEVCMHCMGSGVDAMSTAEEWSPCVYCGGAGVTKEAQTIEGDQVHYEEEPEDVTQTQESDVEGVKQAFADWMDSADVAKIVRGILKQSWPGTKFSVRTSKYAGGSSIDVRWLDGPAKKVVEDAIKKFEGASFDGMTDMKSYNPAVTHEDMTFKSGADYIFAERGISVPLATKWAKEICEKWGYDFSLLSIIDYWEGAASVVSDNLVWEDSQHFRREYGDMVLVRNEDGSEVSKYGKATQGFGGEVVKPAKVWSTTSPIKVVENVEVVVYKTGENYAAYVIGYEWRETGYGKTPEEAIAETVAVWAADGFILELLG